MKVKALYTSFGLIVIGVAGVLYNAYYTNRYSYTAADGSFVLQETLGLPIGMLMILVSIIILAVLAIQWSIGYLKSKIA